MLDEQTKRTTFGKALACNVDVFKIDRFFVGMNLMTRQNIKYF